MTADMSGNTRLMISRDMFLRGLSELKKAYLDFKFDTNDGKAIAIWYEQFKDCTAETFNRIILCYIKYERYAPRSPYELKLGLRDYIQEIIKSRCVDMLMYIEKYIDRHNLAYDQGKLNEFPRIIQETYGETAYRAWCKCGTYIMMEFPSHAKALSIWMKYYSEEIEGVADEVYERCESERTPIGFTLRLARTPILSKTTEELEKIMIENNDRNTKKLAYSDIGKISRH